MNTEQAAHTQHTPDRILQLGLGFWGAKALLSAVELGLFTELAAAAGPLRGEDLAHRLHLHPRSARDFLDTMVALGLLTRSDDGRYANAPDAEMFLDRHKPSYVGGLLEMANARLYPFWGALTEALHTGQPQNEAKGGASKSPFDAIYADPHGLRQFLAAMTGISMGAAAAIAAKFPWRQYKTFVDVGCAQGRLPVHLAMAHEHLTGGGFDLPVVGPVFDEYVRAFELDGRLTFHPGDFMRDPLPTANVLVMGHILHDWDLDQKRMLIAKAHAALPPGGALIAYDSVIDDNRRQNAFGLLMSLNMLIETPGGYDYTGAECQQWFQEAGFRDTRTDPLTGPDSMVIGIK